MQSFDSSSTKPSANKHERAERKSQEKKDGEVGQCSHFSAMLFPLHSFTLEGARRMLRRAGLVMNFGYLRRKTQTLNLKDLKLIAMEALPQRHGLDLPLLSHDTIFAIPQNCNKITQHDSQRASANFIVTVIAVITSFA